MSFEEVSKEPYVEEPKMCVYVDTQRVPRMFRRVLSILHDEHYGSIFIAFAMGSIRLDITNENNVLEIEDDYIEIFNADNQELTLIKTSEVELTSRPTITKLVYPPDLHNKNVLSQQKHTLYDY